MNLSCEYDNDGTFLGYEEKIAISDGKVRCCESGILIPEGQPYAWCRLAWTEYGAYDENDEEREATDEDWTEYPQCLEVWRFVRSSKRNDGTCFAFGDVTDYLSNADGDKEWTILYARWKSSVKRARTRYAKGGGPTLQPFERASLEGSEFVERIPMHDGKAPWDKSGGASSVPQESEVPNTQGTYPQSEEGMTLKTEDFS